MVLYGPSGVGKSSFGAEFQNDGGVGFICDPQEKGIYDLIKFRQCPIPQIIEVPETWKGILKMTDKFAVRRDIKTVVYDSLTGLQQLCYKSHCKEYFQDDWSKEGFYAFQQGPKNAAQRDWPELIQALEVLRESGKQVILIGHSQIKPFKNPDGEDFDKYSPFLEKEVWAATHRWATCVVFYKFQTDTKKVGGRHKGSEESQKRILCTVQGATYDAKNRYGLEPVIMAGDSNLEAYQAFVKAYRKCG
jgi:hypothetical protein